MPFLNARHYLLNRKLFVVEKKTDPNNEAVPLYTKQQRAAVNLCLLGN